LPTPCARDGKGPGHQYGLPDLVEPYGTRHDQLPALPPELLPTPTSGGGTGYMSGNSRDVWRPSLESAVRGYRPTHGGKPAAPQQLLPTPTAVAYGSNRSLSAGAARRPGLHQLAGQLLPTPTVADSRSAANAAAGRSAPLGGYAGRTLTDAARLLPTPRASDGVKGCPGQRGSHGDLTLPSAAVQVASQTVTDSSGQLDEQAAGEVGGEVGGRPEEQRLLPTPRASDARGAGRHGDGGADLRTAVADLDRPDPSGLGVLDEAQWGGYAAAVARWELLIGRPVPEPTQPGTHGRPVLAPRFVEWLMGLEEGWVTDLPLPRTLALRVLGNGVMPQQAAAALTLLLCPHRWAVPA
jgi:DNA (cytosine-5)-methyltransferase 1